MLNWISGGIRLKDSLRLAIKATWVIVVVVFTTFYFWKNWTLLSNYEWQLGIWWIVAAFFCGLFRRLMGGVRWVLIILPNLSQGFFSHLRIQFISQLGNYVPGSLWSLVMRIQMTKNQGISLTRSAFAVVFDIGFYVWSGLVVGLYAVSLVFPEEKELFFFLGLVLAISTVVGLHPNISKYLLNQVMRLLRKPSFDIDLSFRRRAAALMVSILVRIAVGLTQYSLLKGFDPTFSSMYLIYIISATALAWTIGFLAPWAPAGLGVREGVLIWFLEPILPLPLALAGVAASRVLNVIVDVIWACVSLPFNKQRAVPAETRG